MLRHISDCPNKSEDDSVNDSDGTEAIHSNANCFMCVNQPADNIVQHDLIYQLIYIQMPFIISRSLELTLIIT